MWERGRGARWAVRAAQVVLGLVAGLGLAEGGFWLRDGGAFPHLNVYEADAELGVRLRPGATERVSFSGNPITSIRINQAGFRGAELPASSKDEIVVVGDSQVFGLGVEEGEAFPSLVAREMGVSVVNAGVPTYGPPELGRVVGRLVAERRPGTVVYVVNAVNDFFEADRPNARRHVVWDGWAVRRETAPSVVREFPGRALLYRDSHAFFAARQAWQRLGAQIDERGLPSEGTWRDMLDMAAAERAARLRAESETERLSAVHDAETAYAVEGARSTESHVKALVFKALKLTQGGSYFGGDEGSIYLAADANPGDIVVPGAGEEGRPLAATVSYVRKGAELRKKFEAELRRRAEAEADSELGKEITRSLEERDQARKRLERVLSAPVALLEASSPMATGMLAVKAVAEKAGARFVLVTLPIDVAVSPEEWKKYGRAPIDVADTRALLTELVETATRAGATGLDATDALAAAEPGAFLAGDIHMTPKGHRAVADALVKALRAPPPRASVGPRLALPAGRSRPPRPGDWSKVGEVAVTGSTAASCVTKKVREWLYVRCTQRGKSGPMPREIRLIRGGRGDAMRFSQPGQMLLVAPIPQGDELDAELLWEGQSRLLTVRWAEGSSVAEMAIVGPPSSPSPAVDDAAATAAICACQRQVAQVAACLDFVGGADADCARTYADDCPRMLACASGDPVRAPRCPPGAVNAGAALHCFSLCEADAGCPGGACIDDGGVKRCEPR
jgi:hypothetical protein